LVFVSVFSVEEVCKSVNSWFDPALNANSVEVVESSLRVKKDSSCIDR
jgi:hypothetical protein